MRSRGALLLELDCQASSQRNAGRKSRWSSDSLASRRCAVAETACSHSSSHGGFVVGLEGMRGGRTV